MAEHVSKDVRNKEATKEQQEELSDQLGITSAEKLGFACKTENRELKGGDGGGYVPPGCRWRSPGHEPDNETSDNRRSSYPTHDVSSCSEG
jgi:hypothetical protein